MSNQNVQTIARKAGLSIESIADGLGLLILLVLGLSTAGATILVGV